MGCSLGSFCDNDHETEKELVHVRYLVNDSHFITSETTRVVKKRHGVQPATNMGVWVARGLPKNRPTMSDQDKAIVINTWGKVRHKVHPLIENMFKRLLRQVPGVYDVFMRSSLAFHGPSGSSKKSGSHLFATLNLAKHVSNFHMSLGVAIDTLLEPEKFEMVCHDLGDRHAAMDVRIEYLDTLLPFFIDAISPILANDQQIDAWANFLRYMTHLMKESIVF
jgi:hemoglobin-like flavoprotein